MSNSETALVNSLVSGISCCRLRPDDQISLDSHVDDTLAILKGLMINNPLMITLTDSGMRINTSTMPMDAPGVKRLFLQLRSKIIAQVIFGRDIEADEVKRFLLDLASSVNALSPYVNIVIKRRAEKAENVPLKEMVLIKDDLHPVRRVYQDITMYKSINMAMIDAIIGGFLANLRQGIPLRNLIIPQKTDSDDLIVHSSNVALVSVYQAETLGLGSALIHDIGLAALLHDIGKTVLPKKTDEKKASFTETDRESLRKHAVHGAALLASLVKVPDIAIMVAFEHHLKYDGSGYPETRKETSKQHLISQIVAIADFYCALASNVSYRTPLADEAILSLLTEKAGTDFNPLLVANFIKSFGRQTQGSKTGPNPE